MRKKNCKHLLSHLLSLLIHLLEGLFLLPIPDNVFDTLFTYDDVKLSAILFINHVAYKNWCLLLKINVYKTKTENIPVIFTQILNLSDINTSNQTIFFQRRHLELILWNSGM